MSKRLLPLIPAGLLVQQLLPASNRITILARPRRNSAACPDCAVPSRRVHSRYDRRLGDLPWQGRPVTLHIQARRFRCLNASCSRQTFAERLAEVAPLAARRTERLGSLQRCLGLALGGEAGARLAARLAMPVSPDTLLRLACITGSDAGPQPSPRVLGVDDWAWRRGHRYGTALVDLERNRVVDLLPDRQAGSLAAWLKRNPGVRIVARDRAGAYADGIRQGAPEAVQVADRWHLLRNLGGAVQAAVERHHAAVRRAADKMAENPADAASASTRTTAEPNAANRCKPTAHERRHARYMEAARLHAAGMSVSRISRLLGVDHKTLRRWLQAGGVPLWRQPRRGSMLDPHHEYLERRWAQGCRNAARLWRELLGTGFSGGYTIVRTWAARRRQTGPDATRAPTGGKDVWRPPSGRRLTRLLMAEPKTLSDADRAFAARLLEEAPTLAATVTAGTQLALVLQRKSDQPLHDVLAAAEATALAGFVAELRKDIEAVQAALDLPWTTSPVEGQINRLKMIKRTMYGRAGFPLLRARVLQAA